MNKDFLTPVKESVISHLALQPNLCLGQIIRIHTEQQGVPDLENIKIAILGVQEDRNSANNFGCGDNLHFIRTKLYELFPGNWNAPISDLGNVLKVVLLLILILQFQKL